MAPDTPPLNDAEKMHPIARALFGWVTFPRTGQIIFWGLALLSVLLIVGDPIAQRHTKEDIEAVTGFYGLFGFVAFAFAVLMGWPLGRLLRRSETYYDDDDAGQGE
ncbi:MAG: hypothetical protein AAGK23_00300 [Pseudomonadota bacterium]